MSIFCQLTYAQKQSLIGINFSLGTHWPAADLAARFGPNQSLGLGLDWITPQHYILGVQCDYYYSKNVKERILQNLYTKEGYLLGKDLTPANILTRERGFDIMFNIGKLWVRKSAKNISGIRTTFGIGFLQHKIRIQDDSRTVTQLSGDYLKGYDRLTNGFAISQFIGYQHISQNKRLNFFGGFEFTEAFTQSRRAWDWDTNSADKKKRLDILYGAKIGWILPLSINEKSEEYSY
jgi:hypothetical protein